MHQDRQSITTSMSSFLSATVSNPSAASSSADGQIPSLNSTYCSDHVPILPRQKRRIVCGWREADWWLYTGGSHNYDCRIKIGRKGNDDYGNHELPGLKSGRCPVPKSSILESIPKPGCVYSLVVVNSAILSFCCQHFFHLGRDEWKKMPLETGQYFLDINIL